MLRVAVVRLLAGSSLSAALAAQLLSPPVRIAVPGAVALESIQVGDVDGDGHVDLVVSDYGARTLVLRGTGNGSFRPPVTSVHAAPDSMVEAVLTDLDGDGRSDLLVSSGSNGTYWLAGDGLGAFVPRSRLDGLERRIAILDLDHDGRPDVVGSQRNRLLVARGGPSGPVPVTVLPPPPGMPTITLLIVWFAGDVDGDGNGDLVCGDLATLLVLYGDGSGGLDRWRSLPGILFRPDYLTDMDGDRDLDLIATWSDGSVRIGVNEGSLGFRAELLPPWSPFLFRSIPAPDLDGDGRVELLAIADGELIVSSRSAGAPFRVVERHSLPSSWSGAVADFDEDGRTDVVVLGGREVHVLRNASASPRGLASYGTGTPTCRGAIGTTGSRTPNVGAADFRVLCSNAPANATGVLALGTRDLAGTAIPGLDLVLHLGIGWPVAAMTSDAGGAANAWLPLPSARWLAGLTLYAQSFWLADAGLGDTCSPAVAELASSRGLSITLQR